MRLFGERNPYALKEIKLHRVQGIDRAIAKAGAVSYREANELLNAWATTAPIAGCGCHMVAISILWADGSYWESVLELMRSTGARKKPLQQWLRSELAFLAGRQKSSRLTGSQFEEEQACIPRVDVEAAIHLLDNYEM